MVTLLLYRLLLDLLLKYLSPACIKDGSSSSVMVEFLVVRVWRVLRCYIFNNMFILVIFGYK